MNLPLHKSFSCNCFPNITNTITRIRYETWHRLRAYFCIYPSHLLFKLLNEINLIIISSYTIPSSSPLRRSGDENFHFKGFEELSVQSGWLKNLNGVAVAWTALANVKKSSFFRSSLIVCTMIWDNLDDTEDCFDPIDLLIFDRNGHRASDVGTFSGRGPTECGTLALLSCCAYMFLGVLVKFYLHYLHFAHVMF